MYDSDDTPSNPTRSTELADLIESRLSRRRAIGGAVAASVGVFLAGNLSAGKASAGANTPWITRSDDDDQNDDKDSSGARNRKGLGFTEVPTSDSDTIVVPAGYTAEVLIPWGTPLFADSAPFAEDGSNTWQDQLGQVGFNHDGMHYFPLSNGNNGNRRGLLVLNHEYTDANQIYSAALGSAITNDAIGRDKVAKALAAHGVTVVEIERPKEGGPWTHVVGSPFNRRITGTSPMAFSGPVGPTHPMLTSAITPEPIGTLNNCAHGYTPWGTYLACEENWNGYFGTDDSTYVRTALESRYGVSATGFGYAWHKAEPRFNLAVNRNEINRFGWVVEIDPFAPDSVPVKRTALGRIKHEGATVTESNGRVIVYSGDDENGDYLYKFVGNGSWKRARAKGRSPFDDGILYVATFDGTGGGTWLPIVHGTGPLTIANGWIDQADVLIRTRQAADALAATRLHRPEWVAVHPKSNDVYVTLTNGSGNPAPVNSGRDPNPYGHIVRLRERHGKGTSTTFGWEVFAIAGDPAYDANVPVGQPLFGSPDGLWIDPDGRLWIQTDISNSSQNLVSRGYDGIKNNAMLAADPETGELRRFLTGPRGCEITGVITTPDQTTMFVNVQHPGESSSYWNTLNGAPTTTNPTSVSSWPFGGRPRPATVVIRKDDGGKIGT